MKKTCFKTLLQVTLPWAGLFFAVLFCTAVPLRAFTLGQTYDKSNAQEIEALFPPSVFNWVKKGDFIIGTGKINFVYEFEKPYIEKTNTNAGKYDINADGNIIMKGTQEVADYIAGNPFPGKLDTNDPYIADKIMANAKWTTYRSGGFRSAGHVHWINRSGVERQVLAGSQYLPYQNRPQGPIDNPNNFLYQTATFVVQPMDLRGTVSMAWNYNSNQQDTAFAYVPMLRRVRRVAASSRSDPFLGSDFCTDDSFLWSGKNASMKWKYVGEKIILCPFTSSEPININEFADGTIGRKFAPFKVGYMVPGWKGAAWAPVDLTWTPREVWVVDAEPKDAYYNYGRMTYYIDKQGWFIFYKVVYDRAGKYWKTLFNHPSYQVTPKGTTNMPQSDGYCAIDDRTDHASYAYTVFEPSLKTDLLRLPAENLGPQDFAVSALQQMSK